MSQGDPPTASLHVAADPSLMRRDSRSSHPGRVPGIARAGACLSIPKEQRSRNRRACVVPLPSGSPAATHSHAARSLSLRGGCANRPEGSTFDDYCQLSLPVALLAR
jgi:hypothetical protein